MQGSPLASILYNDVCKIVFNGYRQRTSFTQAKPHTPLAWYVQSSGQ